ncbi:MAG: hypothetical protein HXX19_17650, partial [Rhodoferax sp.]|nr:hypothetical protein [Rhodoferax sp.]
VDLAEPFGVHLNGVLLAVHQSEDRAFEFADVLRAGLNARTSNSTNIDAADLAGLRLKQAAGVLMALYAGGAIGSFETEDGGTAEDAFEAVCTLLDQGRDAVRSLNFQEA